MFLQGAKAWISDGAEIFGGHSLEETTAPSPLKLFLSATADAQAVWRIAIALGTRTLLEAVGTSHLCQRWNSTGNVVAYELAFTGMKAAPYFKMERAHRIADGTGTARRSNLFGSIGLMAAHSWSVSS
jgi:hypothetical protein